MKSEMKNSVHKPKTLNSCSVPSGVAFLKYPTLKTEKN